MTPDEVRKLANLYKSPRANGAEQLTHETLDALADVVEAAESQQTVHGRDYLSERLMAALARLEAIKP